MTDVIESRALLMALLMDMPLGPPPPVEGITELSGKDKLFGLSTACASMIELSICAMASSEEEALEGLDILFESMREHIIEKMGQDHFNGG